MTSWSFSHKALIATLLPTILVALTLASIFLFARISDLDRVHEQRAEALARQLAISAEFPLFVADRKHLAAQVAMIGAEPDVVGVAITDAAGKLLSSSGRPLDLSARLPTANGMVIEHGNGQVTRLILPIVGRTLDVEVRYSPGQRRNSQLLGYVALEMSRSHRDQEVAHLLVTGILIVLVGLFVGAVLAARLTRRVTEPIREIGKVVARIADGDLSARVDSATLGSSRVLGDGVNRMAEHLEAGRANLERRIAFATEALRNKMDEAEHATLAKSRVLASASHDLRQPLHALGMFVARLHQVANDPDTLALAAHMERSVEAMQSLLNALLDLSRLEAGTQPVEIHPVRVSELLRRLALDLGARAEQKHLSLRVHPSPAWVSSDPELLYRILLNLTANAVDNTRQGGVLVACRSRGPWLRIEVWDTGIGIPATSLSEIFKEFVQLDNPERDRRKGLGLGLAIVDRTARLLGHRIDVRSRPGRGSRFAVEVRCCQPEQHFAERRQSCRTKPVAADEARVLLIDDDPASREAMVAVLKGWGYRTDTLPDYREGPLASIPDAIVCDFRLPGPKNGIEVIAALRQACGREIPACVVSGDTDPTLAQLAADAGLPLLHKPARAARLEAVLRRLLRGGVSDKASLMISA